MLDAAVLSDLGEPMKILFACSCGLIRSPCSVDANGMVTGLNRGTVEIVITAGEAKNTPQARSTLESPEFRDRDPSRVGESSPLI